mgnify:CR=1 FL=1
MNRVARAFEAEVRHEELPNVPFVLWSKGPFIPWFSGINIEQYYRNIEANFKAQLKLHEAYPETLFWPGIWPDTGPIVEASVFGGEVRYFNDQSPYIMPVFKDIDECKGLKMPDPNMDGLMPEVLKRWEYLWENLDSSYIEDYGYLNGCASIFGPIEVAGQVLGYERLYIAFYEKPAKVASFLDFLSEMLIRWLKAQEKINGKLKRISITDHVAGQISADHFDKFYQPYIKKICAEFPDAIKLYHNESNVYHVLDRIPDLGAEIFHFGVEVKDAKERIGDSICLMGSVHSQEYLMWKGYKEVYEEARRQIRIGGPGGGFLLSVRGGFQPCTPKENIDAMVIAAKDEIIRAF